nr:N-acetylneuraminate 9-O-acetyltransferase-like [Procambarus clarkii]
MGYTFKKAWLWWHGQGGGWSGHQLWYGLLLTWVLITTHVIIFTREHVQHSALNQACYDYNHTRHTNILRNTCCRLHNYSKKDILTCIQTAAEKLTRPKRFVGEDTGKMHSNNKHSDTDIKDHFHSPNEYLLHFHHHPSGDSSLVTQPRPSFNISSELFSSPGRARGWLWAIVGDSRMRQVFSALVTRLTSPGLKYRKPSTEGRWRSAHELADNLRIGKLHEDIEVYHMDVPLRIIFHWDPLLTLLPKLIHQWTNNEKQRPTLLLLGTGLHWMRSTLHTYRAAGPHAAMDKFKQHMDALLPQLVSFAESTYTIMQLQDYIQELHIFKKYKGVYSNSNIDLYNNFVSSYLMDSSVTLWDSNIPFSKAYHANCVKSYRKSFDMLWDCDNPLHTGFVMVEKYADMFLNDICNSFINLDTTYC